MTSAGVSSAVADTDGFDHLAVERGDGHWQLSVRVTGAHCAGCIQKIEGAARQIKGVDSARLNFTTERMVVDWHGPRDKANDVTATVARLGYGVHTLADAQQVRDDNLRFLIRCLGVAGFASGNIMLLSVGLWAAYGSDMGDATRSLMHWISGIIAVPAVMFAGRPFFQSAWAALKSGGTNMDVPISLALILSVGVSLMEAMRHGPHVYFDSAVMLMFFLLIGRTLDLRARQSARRSASDLLATLSGFATRVDGQSQDRIPIRDILPGMQLRVAPGEKIPADGHVTSGSSDINTALVTGESLPRTAGPGDTVHAGTINLGQSLIIEADKVSEDSLLSDMVRLMEAADQGRAKYVRLADRAARLYTPVVHTLALAAFLFWWLIMGMAWQPALMIAVSVLIITCPCALGLAVPVVQVLATGRLFKRGILVKSGDALERLAKTTLAMLDKTGTLTFGTPRLIGTVNGGDLRLAASLAAHSKHPLAEAISAAYSGDLIALDNVSELPGQGLTAQWQGQDIKLGSRGFVGATSIDAPTGPEVWLRCGDEKPIPFCFADVLRPDASRVVADLKDRGVRPMMLSGDNQATVNRVAETLGINSAYAALTPDEKFTAAKGFKDEGYSTLMIGDGLNDTAVLRAADVSIAPGTAIDMAQASADIVFMGEKLTSVTETLDVARLSRTLIKQNFALAVAYNLIAIPLAFSGYVTPLIAALAMSGSSLVVIGNSFRLHWAARKPATPTGGENSAAEVLP